VDAASLVSRTIGFYPTETRAAAAARFPDCAPALGVQPRAVGRWLHAKLAPSVEVLNPPVSQGSRQDRRNLILKPPGQAHGRHEDYQKAHKIVRDPGSRDRFACRSSLNGTIRTSNSRGPTNHLARQFAHRRKNEEGDRAYCEDAQPTNRVLGPHAEEQHAHAGCGDPKNHPDGSELPAIWYHVSTPIIGDAVVRLSAQRCRAG
jgi:hypothetical protein